MVEGLGEEGWVRVTGQERGGGDLYARRRQSASKLLGVPTVKEAGLRCLFAYLMLPACRLPPLALPDSLTLEILVSSHTVYTDRPIRLTVHIHMTMTNCT